MATSIDVDGIEALNVLTDNCYFNESNDLFKTANSGITIVINASRVVGACITSMNDNFAKIINI